MPGIETSTETSTETESRPTIRELCHSTPRDRRNQRRVTWWSLAWGASFLGVTFALVEDWLPSAAWAVAAILVPAILGVVLVLAYRTFLLEADELRRKVEMEALGISVGVGVVFGLSYWLLEQAGVIAEADVATVVVLMLFTHGISVFIGLRRYA